MKTEASRPIADLRSNLRRALTSTESLNQSDFAALAHEYVEVVEQVNARLRRSVGWLRRGLRSEALHLSEQHPDAVDAAALLDLGVDRARWIEICALNQISAALDVDVEAAMEVSRAYEREQMLVPLLDRLRRSVLAGEPIRKRLEVLDSLAAEDPENHIWREQRAMLEPDLLAAINLEAEAAVGRGDRDALEHLLEELRPSRWAKAPPIKLASLIRDHSTRIFRSEAHARYSALAERLRLAHSALERDEVSQLLDEWSLVTRQTGVQPSSEQEADLGVVIAWRNARLAEDQAESEVSQAVEALRRGLDDEAPYLELERLAADVLRKERDIPRNLANRLKFREEQYHRERRHRVRVGSLGVLAAILIIASWLGWTIVWQSRSEVQAQWTATLTELLDAKDFSGFEAALEGLRTDWPSVAGSAAIQGLQLRCERERDLERIRNEQFKAQLDLILALRGGDPQAWGDAVRRLERVAESDEQKAEAQRQRNEFDVASIRAQTERDEHVKKAVERIGETYNAVQKQAAGNDKALVEFQQPLIEELRGLVGLSGVSKQYLDAARALSRIIESDRGAADLRIGEVKAMESALDGIKLSAHQTKRLVEALQEFCDRYGGTDQARSFAGALVDKAAWIAVDDWNTLREGWGGALEVDGPQIARTRIDQIDEYLSRHPGMTNSADVQQYREYLSRAVAAMGSDPLDQPMANLRELLQAPWMHDMKTVVEHGGDRYYTIGGDLRFSGHGFYSLTESARSLADLEIAAKRRILALKLVHDPARPPELKDAPHCVFAREGLAMLGEAVGTRWSSLHLRLVSDLLRVPDIDPVLRVRLLVELLTRHEAYDWPVSTKLTEYRKRLSNWTVQNVRFDQINWLDSNDTIATEARDKAKGLLEVMPDLDAEFAIEVWKNVLSRLSTIQSAGLVWVDDNDDLIVLAGVDSGEFGRMRMAPDGRIIYERVGAMVDRKPEFEKDVAPGTPLFARPFQAQAIPRNAPQ